MISVESTFNIWGEIFNYFWLLKFALQKKTKKKKFFLLDFLVAHTDSLPDNLSEVNKYASVFKVRTR